MILFIITDYYLLFAMLFMQLRGLPDPDKPWDELVVH